MAPQATNAVLALWAFVTSIVDDAITRVQSWDLWHDFDQSTLTGSVAAQTQTVIQGVVIVVVASVGVVIVSNIDSSLDAPSNTGLSESQEGLLEGFGSMIDLIQPLLIVLIAVVLIAVVQRIRTR